MGTLIPIQKKEKNLKIYFFPQQVLTFDSTVKLKWVHNIHDMTSSYNKKTDEWIPHKIKMLPARAHMQDFYFVAVVVVSVTTCFPAWGPGLGLEDLEDLEDLLEYDE